MGARPVPVGQHKSRTAFPIAATPELTQARHSRAVFAGPNPGLTQKQQMLLREKKRKKEGSRRALTALQGGEWLV